MTNQERLEKLKQFRLLADELGMSIELDNSGYDHIVVYTGCKYNEDDEAKLLYSDNGIHLPSIPPGQL